MWCELDNDKMWENCIWNLSTVEFVYNEQACNEIRLIASSEPKSSRSGQISLKHVKNKYILITSFRQSVDYFVFYILFFFTWTEFKFCNPWREQSKSQGEDISPEDEFMALREIFMANLPSKSLLIFHGNLSEGGTDFVLLIFHDITSLVRDP
jgi:hypothetical protein